ncbi:MAG: glycosyltransferase family 39 protein [Anaerolineales bacterium]|nr:glycosyltransferase family 39 protein [Anaerolineales bacterium]
MSLLRNSTRIKPVIFLAVIILAYLSIGTLYAVITPDWQAPDEPAHYNVIRQFSQGTWPRIDIGDYNQEYQSNLISDGFPPEYSINSIQYQDYQPPLYYLLQTPIFWLFGGNLLALRLLSLLFGAAILLITYHTGKLFFPSQPLLALVPTTFIAFIPQHIAIMASVNNDSLAELLLALTLYCVSVLLLSNKIPKPWLVGLVLGAVFITKVQSYIAAPVIVIAILIKWLQKERDNRWLFYYSLGILIPAVCIGSIWWGHNLIVYGGFDIFGLNQHDLVVTGQPTTAAWIAENGLASTLERFFLFTYQSFWGMFGWMAVPMDSRIYQALLVLSIGTLVGLLSFSMPFSFNPNNPKTQVAILFTISSLFTTAGYIWYNLTYVQHQGRYLFPALVPISLALGKSWTKLMQKKPARTTALILCFLGIIALFFFSRWSALFFFGAGALLWFNTLLPQRFRLFFPIAALSFLVLISTISPFLYIKPAL